jgi:hypothetical protein
MPQARWQYLNIPGTGHYIWTLQDHLQPNPGLCNLRLHATAASRHFRHHRNCPKLVQTAPNSFTPTHYQ